MTTQTWEIDEATILEALALIDRGLGDMMHRELVSTDEVADPARSTERLTGARRT